MYMWTVEQLTQAIERCEKDMKAEEAKAEPDVMLIDRKRQGLETLKRWLMKAGGEDPSVTCGDSSPV